MYSFLFALVLGTNIVVAKSESKTSKEEKTELKKKGKKRSKKAAGKTIQVLPSNDSNSIAVSPIAGAVKSPQKARVQTNVHRNVGNERKSGAVKPVQGAKKSPQKARVQTNVHRTSTSDVGSHRRTNSSRPQSIQHQNTPVLVDKSIYTPRGWNPRYHRVELPSEYSSLDPRRWGAGVLHYNPPRSQNTRVIERHKGSRTGKSYQPRRQINRSQQLSLGGRGTVYSSGYVDGGEYVDAGVGLAVGYRFFEALGAEVSYHHFSEHLGSADSDRTNAPIQAVGQVYLFPWTKVSPFVSVGYAWNQIDVNDQYRVKDETKQAIQEGLLTGPVAGAGVEFSFSKHLGLSAEGRYLLYQNIRSEEPAKDNGITLTTGLNLYF